MQTSTLLATTYTQADGYTTVYPFSFAGVNPDKNSGTAPFIDSADVKVLEMYIDAMGNKITRERDCVVGTVNEVKILGEPVALGHTIKIFRKTEIRFPLVDYRDLQSVSEYDLDMANRQAVFLAQEVSDRAVGALALDAMDNLDLGGRKIILLGDGTEPMDAINLRQFRHAIRVPADEGEVAPVPSRPERDGKLLSFDAQGNPIAVLPETGSALDLENKLRLPGGAGMVGATEGTVQSELDALKALPQAVRRFDTVIGADVTGLVDQSLVYCLGRDRKYDGGGGLFVYHALGSTTSDGGTVFVPAVGAGRLVREGFNLNPVLFAARSYNVRWWGAKGDGVTDDTAAVRRAFDALNLKQLYYTLVFPTGRYMTSTQFVFSDMNYGTINMEGALFIGGAQTGGWDAVVKFKNMSNYAVTGSWSITAEAQVGPIPSSIQRYESGLWVLAEPGGRLEPQLGVVTSVEIYGLRCLRLRLAVRIGAYDNDAKTSELRFHGLTTPLCPRAIHISGSQTIASLVSPTLSSTAVAGITTPNFGTVLVEGANLNIVGGDVLMHSTKDARCVDIRPCKSERFGNTYGRLTIVGAIVETLSQFCLIRNPEGLPNPQSHTGGLSLSSCGGYMGDIPLATPVIACNDPTFAGQIAVPDGNSFYRQITSAPRTAANIECYLAPKARITVGRNSFATDTGFKPWMSGTVGGVLTHDIVVAAVSYANGQNLPANVLTRVLWNVSSDDVVRRGRYETMVPTARGGQCTIPDGGLRSASITATVDLGAGNAGTIQLNHVTTGEIIAYGTVNAQGHAFITAELPSTAGGEEYAVFVRPTVARTLPNNKLSKMTLTVAT